MNDIELRFVEREERQHIETYVSLARKIKILQYRKLIKGQYNDYWSEWTDVPLETE